MKEGFGKTETFVRCVFGCTWSKDFVCEQDWKLLKSVCESLAYEHSSEEGLAEFILSPRFVHPPSWSGQFMVQSKLQHTSLRCLCRHPPAWERSCRFPRSQRVASNPEAASRITIFPVKETECHFYYSGSDFEDAQFVQCLNTYLCMHENVLFQVTFRHVWRLPLFDDCRNTHFARKTFQVYFDCPDTTPLWRAQKFAELIVPRHFGPLRHDEYHDDVVSSIPNSS